MSNRDRFPAMFLGLDRQIGRETLAKFYTSSGAVKFNRRALESYQGILRRSLEEMPNGLDALIDQNITQALNAMESV